MNLSLRQVRYICVLADCGSIQGASRVLRISPSSIFAAIESAELSLGARICDRRRASGIQLTPSGERFVAAGRQLLMAETDFKRQIGLLQTQSQSLRIGCFEPFGQLFMVEGLRRFTNEVGPVEVSLFEGDQTQLSDWLNRGLVDLVFTYDIGPSFNAHLTKVCRVPAHVLLPIDHPLIQKTSLSIVDLLPYPQVLLDLPLTVTYLTALFDSCRAKPIVNFRTRSYETIRNAVAGGFGIAILNMRPFDYLNKDSPTLVRIPLSDDLPAPVLQIADLYGSLKPRGIRNLINVFVAMFREDDPGWFAVTTPERRHLLFEV